MRRNDNFGFRVSDIERAMIADLARRLKRSQGDAVRLVIREAVLSLQAQTDTMTDLNTTPTASASAQQAGAMQNATA